MKINLFIILLLLVKTSIAQSFITKASATSIGKNDVVQIEYIAENVSLDQFVLPSFNKFTVVSGPNLSSSTTQIGNVVKQQISYSVMLQATTPGTFIIPGATALINNKPRRSNGVAIVVKNVDHLRGSAPPAQTSPQGSLFDQMPFEDQVPANQFLKKGEKAIDKIRNNIIVRLEVNKHSSYVGEPILATYKLCTRLRSKSKVVKQPQFSGCTVIELTGEQQDAHIEKINGVDYNVFVIRKVELFPLEAGKLELPATSIENRVTFYDASHQNYRDLYYGAPSLPVEEQLVTLKNKTDFIDVKPLPPMASVTSSDFSGAVGTFNVALAIGDPAVSTNNTNHLFFTVQGEGNLQQVKPPAVQWPKGIEAFEPTEQAEDDKSAFPVKTKKIFSIPFVVDKKGDYTLPPVQFTYFDPNANRYITKKTSGLLLRVAQGSKTFLGISSKSTAHDGFGFDERLYILLGAGLLALINGLVWFSKRPKQPLQPVLKVPATEEKALEIKQPESTEYLYKIRELQPELDSSSFYKLLCKNLHAYLCSKFQIPADQLPSFIEQQPGNVTDLTLFKGLLDDCSLGMYTPVYRIEEAMQHRLLAIEVLSRLERI
ncbi:MAG: BatD family protein [Segetibacter sp.]